jgi:hypothetical protein
MTYDTGSRQNGNIHLWMTEEQVVLKFRSVNNMVIAPASTGSDNKSGNAVTRTDHTNRGDLCIVIPGPRMLEIVVIKLIEPKMDEIPDR